MPKTSLAKGGTLLAVVVPVVAVLSLVLPSTMAQAGNTTVLVVPQSGSLGVIEVEIPEHLATKVEKELAKGKFPVIETQDGLVQIRGLTRGRELLGTEAKGEIYTVLEPD